MYRSSKILNSQLLFVRFVRSPPIGAHRISDGTAAVYSSVRRARANVVSQAVGDRLRSLRGRTAVAEQDLWPVGHSAPVRDIRSLRIRHSTVRASPTLSTCLIQRGRRRAQQRGRHPHSITAIPRRLAASTHYTDSRSPMEVATKRIKVSRVELICQLLTLVSYVTLLCTPLDK